MEAAEISLHICFTSSAKELSFSVITGPVWILAEDSYAEHSLSGLAPVQDEVRTTKKKKQLDGYEAVGTNRAGTRLFSFLPFFFIQWDFSPGRIYSPSRQYHRSSVSCKVPLWGAAG